jgi:diguanylate cyclase (GGDEF)-like protein
MIQRQNRRLHGCFVLLNNGHVRYAVAPTLGGEFASSVEHVATTLQRQIINLPPYAPTAASTAPVATELAGEPAWTEHLPAATRLGLVVCHSLPIRSQGDALGNLLVFSSNCQALTPNDVELLQTIAHRAAIAIEHQALLERLAHQSLYDPLTSLPNRTLMDDRLQHALARARRDGAQIGLFLIDIDRFKAINDAMGHPSGDEVLRQLAERLRVNMRASDTVARVGADEFAVVAPELQTREGAVAVAQKLVTLLSEPALVAGRELALTASVGAAVFPSDGADPSSLHQAADRALGRAKTLGRNRFAFYDYALGLAPSERNELEMESLLRCAIRNNELSVQYQPQLDAAGRVIGVEALLRWENPRLGRISPSQFIPVAEQTGLIVPIGEWVLREACRRARSWIVRGEWPIVRMAVNVSALQFAQPQFLSTVQDILRESKLEPRWLEVELTESLLMQNTQDTAAKLSALRDLGVAAAIDDFGTGYSSLAYLRRLPIDTLKIDRSFVSDINLSAADDSATAVIRAILSMARSLGLHVVAEGVETEIQREFLIRNGCPLMQGFLFSRPLSAGDIEKFLAKSAPPSTGTALALSA